MAPATEGDDESEVSQQRAGPGLGPAPLGEINEEWSGGDSPVRLPKIDLRQPTREGAAYGAKAEVATRKRSNLNSLSLASSLSIPFQPPLVRLPPQAPILDDDVKPIINRHDQPLKKATRSLFPRGTRGRGDPRNARMRAERLRYDAEQLAERQKQRSAHLSSKFISLLLSIQPYRLGEFNGSPV